MTDNINTGRTISRFPTHIAYHVQKHTDKEGFWTRIGSAWSHADGKGFSIQLNSTPVDGRIALRVSKDERN